MTGRPAQKTQPSRKGKRAWRKNIDLDALEEGLDTKREQEAVLGPGPLFEIDTKGDEKTAEQMKKKYKSLRSLDILNNKSAVPALKLSHRKPEKPKRKATEARIHTLQRASGRTGESTIAVDIERDGLNKGSGNMDLWAADANVAAPKVAHTKLQPEPLVADAQAVELPHAGRSYNPTLDDWRALIKEEHSKLEVIELQRIKYEAERAEIEEEMRISAEKAELAEQAESSDESEPEIDGKLSVNDPVRVKRKTKQQRRRAARAKEVQRQQQRHKLLKQRLHLLKQEEHIAKLAEKKARLGLEEAEAEVEEQAAGKKHKIAHKHSKHSMLEAPLAIKLSHELEGSLRRLKPEGSLAMERVASLQARGIIEPRIPVKAKKAKVKKTEKWSYKNFDAAIAARKV